MVLESNCCNSITFFFLHILHVYYESPTAFNPTECLYLAFMPLAHFQISVSFCICFFFSDCSVLDVRRVLFFFPFYVKPFLLNQRNLILKCQMFRCYKKWRVWCCVCKKKLLKCIRKRKERWLSRPWLNSETPPVELTGFSFEVPLTARKGLFQMFPFFSWHFWKLKSLFHRFQKLVLIWFYLLLSFIFLHSKHYNAVSRHADGAERLVTARAVVQNSVCIEETYICFADSEDVPVLHHSFNWNQKESWGNRQGLLFEERSFFIRHRCGAQPKLELYVSDGSALTDGDNSGRN